MLTRIEIDGFKTFERFALDLSPLTAIVGPNASGKSNLFDAIRFLSKLATQDVRSAMKELRGEPEEFFRRTAKGVSRTMRLGLEMTVGRTGVDDFGRAYEVAGQRLRYEVGLEASHGVDGALRGVFVRHESCRALKRAQDQARRIDTRDLTYNNRKTPFLDTDPDQQALLFYKDGAGDNRGRPQQLPLKEASRTGLSTITTSEYPHLFAVRDALTSVRFLEINPAAARAPNDRFESTTLKADASNLAAVLFHLRERTRTEKRPDGILSDIAADLSALIPSVARIGVEADAQKRYSFEISFEGDLRFSSRVISDGTLRLLALIAVLNDPDRRGTLCFEEPENGVHEGRIPKLVEYLRAASDKGAWTSSSDFQVLVNTHSPVVMQALADEEIVAADIVRRIVPGEASRVSRTRMRTGVSATDDLLDPEHILTRVEIDRLLRHTVDAA